MTRTTQRLARLEAYAAPADHPLVIIRRVRAESGAPLSGRIVTHDGAPTADAIAARAHLVAEGFTVAPGFNGRAA